MKLSEAIQLGAMLRPQGTDVFFDGLRTCALGAATEAIGLPLLSHMPYEFLARAIPELRDGPADCPACGERKFQIGYAVAHLNDSHRWTREQIADWVATIEAQHEQAAQPAAALVTVGP